VPEVVEDGVTGFIVENQDLAVSATAPPQWSIVDHLPAAPERHPRRATRRPSGGFQFVPKTYV
jgi:hypothetical protein